MTTDANETGFSAKADLKTWIFNPFHYLAGGQALALGLAFIVAAGLLGSAVDVHFDGVLDLHVGMAAPVWLFPIQGTINWLSISVILVVAGYLLSRTRFRILDIFGTQALARAPSMLSAAVAYVPGFRATALKLAAGNPDMALPEIAGFTLAMLVILLAIIWMVILMYRGFVVSCNVGGGRAVAVFIAALILAEVISKAAIIGLFMVVLPGY